MLKFLINLKKAGILDCHRTLVTCPEQDINRGLLAGDRILQSLCFKLLGFCLKSGSLRKHLFITFGLLLLLEGLAQKTSSH